MKHETETTIFFWRPENFLSNWHPCPRPFMYAGHLFYNSEAAFMYGKAILFNAPEVAKQIVLNQDPKLCKSKGRSIEHFDEDVWTQQREEIMWYANYAKFSQNPSLGQMLLNTGNKMLVEASPYDKIWGIGLAPNDPLVLDPRNWKGLNLLGKVLMDVRFVLANKNDLIVKAG